MKHLKTFLFTTLTLFFIGCAVGDPTVSTPTAPRVSAPSATTPGGFNLTAQSNQVLLGVTEGWNNSNVTLQLFQRDGQTWSPVTDSWQGRLGKNGSSWGRGMHPPQAGSEKVEGDGRTPAGVFHIGGVWGYAPTCEKVAGLPYKQITTRDLWIEDQQSPYYNQHLTLNREPVAQWEQDGQMRQGDYAHSLKMFIAHNAPPRAVPGKGSAIFFHIWRGGGSKATAGCTTMEEGKLRSLISKINPALKPTYVLLPREEYNCLKTTWQLP